MSKGPKNQTTTTQAQVPSYLQPYISNQANTGNTTLTSLADKVNNGNLVAGFNPNQVQGQNTAVGIAQGAGGYLPNAVNQLNNTLTGNPNMDALTAASLQGLTRGATKNVVGGSTSILDQIAKDKFESEILSQFANNPFVLDQDAQAALRSGAQGEYLYGNPAFDEAVQASIRAAQPNVLSGFANAGSGGVSGGLSQVAQQQVASDAFARLFNDERNRQLQSASQLGNFQLAGNDQQIGAATNLGGLQLQDKSIRSNAASNSGQLSLSQQAQNTSAASQIGNLLNAERNRQMQASQLLPDASLAGSNILNQVGGTQQNQAQTEISAPIAAQTGLLNTINSGLPTGALVGQKINQPVSRNPLAGGFGGLLVGDAVGNDIFGSSNPLFAIGGGLLGAFG